MTKLKRNGEKRNATNINCFFCWLCLCSRERFGAELVSKTPTQYRTVYSTSACYVCDSSWFFVVSFFLPRSLFRIPCSIVWTQIALVWTINTTARPKSLSWRCIAVCMYALRSEWVSERVSVNCVYVWGLTFTVSTKQTSSVLKLFCMR